MARLSVKVYGGNRFAASIRYLTPALWPLDPTGNEIMPSSKAGRPSSWKAIARIVATRSPPPLANSRGAEFGIEFEAIITV